MEYFASAERASENEAKQEIHCIDCVQGLLHSIYIATAALLALAALTGTARAGEFPAGSAWGCW